MRSLLFRLEAERSHDLIIALLAILSRSKSALRILSRYGIKQHPSIPCQVAGLHLPNPLGLAAGFDKNGKAFPALAALGFGWTELGTVTPKAQSGNPKKRLFRITADAALINRMGFNSVGLGPFVDNVKKLRSYTNSIIGINIGKNAQTSPQQAIADYLAALDAVYELGDYVAINISSPNTEGLRELQNIAHLGQLLDALAARRGELAADHARQVPLILKISPDLDSAEIETIAAAALQYKLDGIIATNTTVSRPKNAIGLYTQNGGLSGRPLQSKSTQIIHQLWQSLGGQIPIIGVGGIESAIDVREKIKAGAQVVQLYTSFIYNGPSVISKILAGLEQDMNSMHINDWGSWVEKVRTE